MSYQPYYITQYEQDTGYENYFESYLLPERAFPKLEDAYCWRGRVKRRGGVYLLGRLQRKVDKIKLTAQAFANPYLIADLLAAPPIDIRSPAAPAISEPNAEIAPHSVTIYVGALVISDDGIGGLSDGAGTIGAINYITGAISLTFNPALGAPTDVFVEFSYYPALPVMGLRRYGDELFNNFDLIAFDQKYAYRYDYVAYRFYELTAPGTTWTGSNASLFWTVNYNISGVLPVFWVTNFTVTFDAVTHLNLDPIRYFNGVTWTDFTPAIDLVPNFLYTCLAMLPFKERLFCFNTFEGPGGIAPVATNYPQRIRWCAPLSDPTVAANWLVKPGGAGFIDLPTDDEIVAVEYIKDVILIKCTSSSWKLVYTGDQVLPVAAQKINADFGGSSAFSLVPFDDGVFSVALNGITTDDSTAVERIDLQIPDEYITIQPAPARTYGIRDYERELVYWAFTFLPRNVPISSFIPTNPDFNNQVLVFNYRNNSYAKFNDSYMCFGQFYIVNPSVEMVNTTTIRRNSLNVIAGNQQGFVEVMGVRTVNSPSLAITAITPGSPVTITSPNHNFNTGTAEYWVRLSGIVGTGAPMTNPNVLNNLTTGVAYHLVSSAVDLNTFKLEVWDAINNVFVNVVLPAGGAYLGGGKITIVQNFDIETKVFAPFYENGQQVRVPYIDFLTDTTIIPTDPVVATYGQYCGKVTLNENPAVINDPLIPGNQGLLGSNIIFTANENPFLYLSQGAQAKIWHRFFSPYISQNFQLKLTMNELQMSYYDINDRDFVLHAMTLYLSPNARMTK